MSYLSVCSIYRDDAEYLPEWIEFHRLVGVERFLLYNNFSVDSHREVLAPYVAEGTVEIHDWPEGFPQALRRAYDDCLSAHREDSRWIAFIDVDEFLFSPEGRLLPDVLAEYEEHPGVAVNWAMFGTSGHAHKPEGLVTESYVQRTADPGTNNRVKSIVDPRRAIRCKHSHHFAYASGSAVDENHQPVDSWYTPSVSFSKLRVNHYWTRSEAEARRKWDLWDTTGTPRPWRMYETMRDSLNELHDDTITRYVPALRAALDRRAAGRPTKV